MKRQVSVLYSTLQNWETATDATTKALESNGSALKENATYLDSIEGKINTFNVSVQKMWSNALSSEFVKGFVGFGNTIVNIIDKLGLVNVLIATSIGLLFGTKKGKSFFEPVLKFTNDLITAQKYLALQQGITLTSTQALTKGLLAQAKAMSVWLFTTPIGQLTLLAGAITAVTISLATSNNRQQKLFEEAKGTYEETTDKLKEVQTELEKVTKSIDILNSKDFLTFVEKEELSRLKEVSRELKYQEDILKRQAESDAKKLAKEATGKFNKQFGKYEISQDKVDQLEQAEGLTPVKNAISSTIALYKRLSQEKDNAIANNTEFAKEDILQKQYENLNTYLKDLNTQKQALLDVEYNILSEDDKQALEDIKEAERLIYHNVFSDEWNSLEIEELFNSDAVIEFKEELIDLAKKGELKPETLDSYDDLKAKINSMDLVLADGQTNIDAFIGEIIASSQQTETELDKVIETLYKLAEVSGKVTGYVNDLGQDVDISKVQKAVEEAITAVDDYKDILKNMSKYGNLTSDDLAKITSKYPKYLSYIDNEKELRKQLKKGIEEQQKVAENYYTQILEIDTNFYNEIIQNNADKVNELNRYYGIDFGNFKSLADAKYQVETTLLSNLKKKWEDYNKIKDGAEKIKEKAEDTYSNSDVWGSGGKAIVDVTKGVTDKIVDKLKKDAEEAQSFYDKALNFVNTDYTGKTVDSILKTSGNQKEKKEFSKVFDWIEVRIKKAQETAQKSIDKIADYFNYKTKNSKIDVAITAKKNEKKSLTESKDEYNKRADNIKFTKSEAKYKDLVINGTLDIETITDENLAKKIQEYQDLKEKAKSVGDEIENINDQIKDLNKQKLDSVTDYFDNRKGYAQSKIDKRDSLISLKEQKGTVKSSDYKYAIDLQKKYADELKSEYEAYSEVLNSLKSTNGINSAEYKDGLVYLNSLKSELNGVESSIYDLNVRDRELKWKSFDKGIEKAKNLQNEISDLSDLIKDSDAIGKDGQFTQSGTAKIGLLAQSIATSKGLISDYSKAISKLNGELKRKEITQDIYDEEVANYLQAQRDEVKNIESLTESIASLAKLRVEHEIKAINEETEAYEKSVDAKKDALKATKDLHDYEKSIEKKTSNISKLQKQIASLALSTNRKDIAERLKLEQQLKEAQAELAEEQYQNDIKLQENALDKDLKAYEDAQDKKVKSLEDSLEDQMTLVKNALNDASKFSSSTSSVIQSLASKHGITLTESVVNPWKSATSALSIYKSELATIPSVSNTGTSKNTKVTKKDLESVLGKSNGKDKSAEAKKLGLSKLNQYIMGKGYETITRKDMSELAEMLGIKGISADTITSDQKNSILEALKKVDGFATGGVIGGVDIKKATGEDVLIPAGVKERVLTPNQNENFEQMVDLSSKFVEVIGGLNLNELVGVKSSSMTPNIIGNIKANDTAKMIQLDIGNLINIEGNTDQSILNEMQKMVDNVPNVIIEKIKYSGL